jgi:PD-(D/E)XK nuclease superfamily
MNLGPKGHLSPTGLNAWERCQIQFRIFRIEGFKSPPDFALTKKIKTHEVVLERDLGQKIKSGVNLADSELSEMYRAGMEESAQILRDDPNLTTPVEKAIEEEVPYFDKILKATRPWREQVTPLAVEKPIQGEIGGVPVSMRMDLVADEGILERVRDLKRQGRGPMKGSAIKNRQLVSYAAAGGYFDVALDVVVENKTPTMTLDEGQITPGEVERVKLQYQAAADQIDNALRKDIWAPVDHGDQRKAWVCSADFCGAWRLDAKDWVTGKNIACPYGQRAQESVYGK